MKNSIILINLILLFFHISCHNPFYEIGEADESDYIPEVEFVKQWGSFGASRGITVDNHNFVYVADDGSNLIYKYNSDGGFIKQWGSLGTGSGQFNSPRGIAAGQDGSIYVAENLNHRIQKFDSDGNFIKMWGRNGGDGTSGTGAGEFTGPEKLAVDNDYYVYVVDSNNHRVQKFDSDGNFIKMWGRNGGDGTSGTDIGEFSTPYRIGINYNNVIYVSESLNTRIQIFSPDGIAKSLWNEINVSDIDFDSAGNIYTILSGGILNVYSNNRKLLSSTSLIPVGIGIDFTINKNTGYIYIVDDASNHVYKYKIKKWESLFNME